MSDERGPVENTAPAASQDPKSASEVHATAEPSVPKDQAASELPEEWKPEPREWNWKDVFTAPMLAFKPKCMLISFLTIVVLGCYAWGTLAAMRGVAGIPVLEPVLCWLFMALGAVIFGIGATFVSIFFKADLLDDEFLSCGEACSHFKGRFIAAIMVPLFLVGIVAGFNLLIYLALLICSIPYFGGLLYALLYPLGWLLALFTVMLSIGAVLALFVGPAVIAVRKHGWFDNVIDTFEAVGTKPHQLLANLVLSLLLVTVAFAIPQAASLLPGSHSVSQSLPSKEVARVEYRSEAMKTDVVPSYSPLSESPDADFFTHEMPSLSQWFTLSVDPAGKAILHETGAVLTEGDSGGVYKVFGFILAIWKLLLLAALFGYLLNVFLAGGMLTYLAIREDDYWDDEDLEDLDKLAKELEEEAQREAEATMADSGKSTAAPAAAATRAPAEATPRSDAKKNEPPQAPASPAASAASEAAASPHASEALAAADATAHANSAAAADGEAQTETQAETQAEAKTETEPEKKDTPPTDDEDNAKK